MYLCRLHCKQNGYGKLCIYVDSIVNRMDMANYVFMSTPLKQNGYGKLCIYVHSIVNRMDMANYEFMSTPL